MTQQAAWPLGSVVRLNARTRVQDGGRALLGGAPTRVMYLTPGAAARFEGRTLTVRDPATAVLAEKLVDAGIADPVAASLPAGDLAEVTYVIPVRDRPAPLARLLASLDVARFPPTPSPGAAIPTPAASSGAGTSTPVTSPDDVIPVPTPSSGAGTSTPAVAPGGVGGPRVIVVDDCSEDAGAVRAVAERFGAEFVGLETNVGPAGARNAGLRRVRTAFVAFVDSDVVLQPDGVALMLPHFADPKVALVAPRVQALPDAAGRTNWIGRYENARSSLDLGGEPAIVRQRAPVSWVSSTMLLGRVDALGDGFAEGMHVGEDVDLVWALADRGQRIRYEPAAAVWHEHRTSLRPWLARKAFYGTGAHPLALRHPHDIAPAVLAPWSAAVVAVLLAQRRWSVPVALAISAVTAVRLAGSLARSEHPLRTAAGLTARGLAASLVQGMALLLRHWWPLVAVGCLFSRRLRRAVLVAHLADVVIEQRRTRVRLDPVRFALARRLDDLAYGAGVWLSALRGRSWGALLPDIRRRR